MQAGQAQDWIKQSIRSRRQIYWRAVEAQPVVATRRFVDTLDEQDLLEQIRPPSAHILAHLAAGARVDLRGDQRRVAIESRE